MLEGDDFISETVPPVPAVSELKPSCREYLISHRFLVNLGNDDSHDVDEIRYWTRMYQKVKFKGFGHFAILTQKYSKKK